MCYNTTIDQEGRAIQIYAFDTVDGFSYEFPAPNDEAALTEAEAIALRQLPPSAQKRGEVWCIIDRAGQMVEVSVGKIELDS